MIEISIVICTRNRAEDLRHTLMAIGQLSTPDSRTVEMVVIDNGSSDCTAAVAEECRGLLNMPLRYVCEPKKGLAQARNTGLAEAKGAILLFTDDDIRPPTHWISRMCAPILAGEAQAVAGDIVIAPHLERPWMQPIHRSYLAAHKGNGAESVNMTGANMGFSREVLQQVPRFDVELGAGALGCCEESLFSWQVKRAGYKVLAVPEAAVEHHFHESRLRRRNFLDCAKGIGRSQAYVQYHWEHTDQRHIALRRLRKAMEILVRRRVQKPIVMDAEGIAPWEMQAVAHLYLLSQYAFEQKRPRNYERHSLQKRI